MSVLHCAYCGKPLHKTVSEINRAARQGKRLFCNMVCFGKSRRIYKTKAQKAEEKRLYDAEYRRKNRALLKAKKAAYFKRTYDPAMAAIARKRTMPRHVEYCRQPRYKAYKRAYDRTYRAREYGAFADAYLLAIELNREIKQRASNYEIRLQNETLNKRIARARAEIQAASRDPHSRAQG